MSGQVRRIETIGLVRESDAAPGVAESLSSGMCISVDSGILRPIVQYTPNMANFGANFDSAESFVTYKRSELVFTAPLKTDWLGHILTGILGDVSSALASGESAAWEHAITLVDGSVLPSYTMFILNSIQAKRAVNGTVKKVTIKCPSNGLATVTVEMCGRAFEDGSGAAVYVPDHHLQGSMLSPRTAGTLGGLPAGTLREFHDMTIVFEREIFMKQVHGNLDPSKFYAGPLKVTCDISNTYEDDTFRDMYEAGDNTALRFDFQDTDTTIGIAENPGLTIDLAKMVIQDYNRPEGIDEDDVETLKMKSLYDLEEGTPQFGNILLTNEENTTAYVND